ncbi:MAG: aspartyl/asparaginyl beta-hydroxylase domain-containing protein [Verrucomicrobiaceae bacterium]|nr:aspartyl/asparaginyl beta-hydroxylase domain-containing protein [Verrucomicrobiaceae bacterium]
MTDATTTPVTAPSTDATAHARGTLPLADYDRTHRLQPATGWFGTLLDKFTDWIEDVLARFSVHGDPPVYSNEHFPWVDAVEADWHKVRAELDAVMQYRDSMPSFQDIVKEVGLIQNDNDWKTFFLRGVGMDCRENALRCPETMKVLDKIPYVTTAFFSILSPRKHIPSHRGPWAGILRLHVGLMVPEPRDKVRIRIANQTCLWQEGKCLIFDDTWNHEVWNDTDGYRVVLFIDFARPLKWPLNWINHLLLNLAPLAPFLREAKGRQKAWELRMWGGKK